MVVRSGFWKWPATALGAVAFTLPTQSVQAFFPPIPLGSDPITVLPPPPAPVIVPINPIVEIPGTNGPTSLQPIIPIVPPPPFSPPNVPTSVPPTCICVPPNRPSTVPEPMTVVSGLIGVSLVGLWKARRRKEDSPAAE
jgi:hypothetical protein